MLSGELEVHMGFGLCILDIDWLIVEAFRGEAVENRILHDSRKGQNAGRQRLQFFERWKDSSLPQCVKV